jgi:chromosome segregation ATPase
MTVDLLVRAKDDFGFSKLQIAWRLAKSRYEEESEDFTTIDLPLQAGQTSPAEAQYHWDLSGMQLAPEDVISYYAEVFDNDNVSGPKSAKSETFQLRLPSLEEMFSDVATSHEQSVESMQQVAKEAEQLKQDVEQMQREMRKSPSKPDWQQQKKADQMSQRYEAMKKKVEEATAKLDEMMKKMDDNNLLSDKTMEKYEELQKLMKELNSPELQEAMKKLQESMKQLSPEQMRQAMDQLKFSEEQFRQNLERTIELLKRVHIEQKVDEVLKRTEELTKQQAVLQNETKKDRKSVV